MPQGLDGGDLREEAMPAEIEAIALVADGSGDSADRVIAFEDDDPRVGALREHVRRRQSRGAGADDDDAVAREQWRGGVETRSGSGSQGLFVEPDADLHSSSTAVAMTCSIRESPLQASSRAVNAQNLS